MFETYGEQPVWVNWHKNIPYYIETPEYWDNTMCPYVRWHNEWGVPIERATECDSRLPPICSTENM